MSYVNYGASYHYHSPEESFKELTIDACSQAGDVSNIPLRKDREDHFRGIIFMTELALTLTERLRNDHPTFADWSMNDCISDLFDVPTTRVL